VPAYVWKRSIDITHSIHDRQEPEARGPKSMGLAEEACAIERISRGVQHPWEDAKLDKLFGSSSLGLCGVFYNPVAYNQRGRM